MTIGKRIKEIRLAAGLTQKQLAEICGLAEITIRQYENEKRQPKLQALMKIGNALDVAIFSFLDEELSSKEIDNLMTQQRLDSMGLPIQLSKFLTSDEIRILHMFRELNEIGQEKADDDIFTLTQVPQFRKEPKRKHWKTPLPPLNPDNPDQKAPEAEVPATPDQTPDVNKTDT